MCVCLITHSVSYFVVRALEDRSQGMTGTVFCCDTLSASRGALQAISVSRDLFEKSRPTITNKTRPHPEPPVKKQIAALALYRNIRRSRMGACFIVQCFCFSHFACMRPTKEGLVSYFSSKLESRLCFCHPSFFLSFFSSLLSASLAVHVCIVLL